MELTPLPEEQLRLARLLDGVGEIRAPDVDETGRDAVGVEAGAPVVGAEVVDEDVVLEPQDHVWALRHGPPESWRTGGSAKHRPFGRLADG